MGKIVLIILGLLICFGCKKKIVYQPPKEDLTNLIELAFNLCNANEHNNYFKNRNVFYIKFYNSENPLKRKIKYLGNIVNSDVTNYTNKDIECLIMVGEYKKISPTKFYIHYGFKGSNVETESIIIYKDNKWVSGDCINSVF